MTSLFTRVMRRRRARKVGLAPGSLVYTGEVANGPPKIRVLDYGADTLREEILTSVEACLPYRDSPTVSWIHVEGVHDEKLLEAFGHAFQIDPLAVEDILNTDQRPKLEDYGQSLFIVLQMIRATPAHPGDAEQVSLIVGKNFLLSFQEHAAEANDPFEAVRVRVRSPNWRNHKLGTDYLAYAIIDTIVDHYFVVLEQQGDTIQALEDRLALTPTAQPPQPKTLQQIQALRRELILCRKFIWPLREVLANFQRSDSPLLHPDTPAYLRDVYDHTIHVMDTIDSYRDILAGMTDLYMSTISNRMNAIMQVLTVIATIFIPITFIASVYGMNFKAMPELEWPWGYPMVLTGMALTSGGMLLWFRRRGWL